MPTPLQYMQFSLGVYASSARNFVDPPIGWNRTAWLQTNRPDFLRVAM